MAKQDLGRCAKRFMYDSWHDRQCLKNAVVIRKDKAYCKVHDPIRIKEKNDKKYKEYRLKLEPEERIHRKLQIYPELLEALKSTRMLHLEQYEKNTIGNKVYLEIEQVIAKAELLNKTQGGF